MSFEPVTCWALRCDGEVPGGQCLTRYHVQDDEDETLSLALWETPEFTAANRIWLTRGSEWALMPDGRVLCPAHVAAAESRVAAGIDGLPFDDAVGGGE